MFYPNRTPKIQTHKGTALKEILNYTIPKLYTGSEWYVGFYAFDPLTGQMRRKRIKINRIKSVADRRRYATDLIKRLFDSLEKGWNPWVEAEIGTNYYTFNDVCEKFRAYLTKMYNDGNYRDDTYTGYISKLKNMREYNSDFRRISIYYIYQFDKAFCNDMLDYMYIDRNNSAQTRNNYLAFLRAFSQYCVSKGYLNSKPTDGIAAIAKRLIKKQRTIIPDNIVKNISNYLYNHDRHFLLACNLLFYCFIRPKEMSKLKIENINVKNSTIFIPGEISKNRGDAVISLPTKVIKLMLDLEIFKYPASNYIFSDDCIPGTVKRIPKMFRDHWEKVRTALNFQKGYKFYSLKDTGITSMLRQYDSLTVRDQARHSSLLMTDVYTPHDIQEANKLIIEHKGVL